MHLRVPRLAALVAALVSLATFAPQALAQAGGIPLEPAVARSDPALLRQCRTTEQALVTARAANPDLWIRRLWAANAYANQVYAMAGIGLVVEAGRLERLIPAARRQSEEAVRASFAAGKKIVDDEDLERDFNLGLLEKQLALVRQAQTLAGTGFKLDRINNDLSFYVEDGRKQAIVSYNEALRSCVEEIRTLQVNAPPPRPGEDDPGDDVEHAPYALWMTGTFDSDFGVLQLSPGGGTYEYQGGRVSVIRISGKTMEGKWHQVHSAKQCQDGSYSGRFTFTFSEFGFSGSYGYCDDDPGTGAGGGWNGKRK